MFKIGDLIKDSKIIRTISKKKFELLTLFISVSSVIIITGLIVEMKFRKDHYKYHQRMAEKYKYRELCYQTAENPKLIYELVPERCGANFHGFYGPDYSYEKKDYIYRIVVIGDSVARGEGLDSYYDSFPMVLQKKLNQSGEVKLKVEVITLAVSGYSTCQELIVMKEKAFEYHPDLIIWSYVLNDPAHPVYHNANGELGLFFYKPKSYFINFIARKIFFVKERWKAKKSNGEFHHLLHVVYWKEVQRNIKKIAKVSLDKDVPLLFLIHPIFEPSGFENYSLTKMHQQLCQEAVKNDLDVMDILDEYQKYPSDQIKVHSTRWFDPWHPNAEGHEIIADYIYDRVLSYTK